MRDAAHACLDGLRGAAVLVKQNGEALIRLLAAQQSEEVGAQGHRDGRMLESLVQTLSHVVEAAGFRSTQAGGERGEVARDGHNSAPAEGRRKDDARRFDTKRPRVEEAAGGGQQQQQQHQFLSTPNHHVASARAGQRPMWAGGEKDCGAWIWGSWRWSVARGGLPRSMKACGSLWQRSSFLVSLMQ